MEMTKEEIVRKYQRAETDKEKKEQIQILAELNATTEAHIRQVLREMGVLHKYV